MKANHKQQKAIFNLFNYDHDHQFKVIIFFIHLLNSFIPSSIDKHKYYRSWQMESIKLPKRKQKQDNYETCYNIYFL